ncbi:cupin domain-containing protein [Kocuria sediminis]|uniref:Cupin domain-containing protein n=1 Tax=Kocuria sediminis TaxID=1038857 RepID=A0A6N8GU18_9MICC|nr:cupin domain-containing protein [Kocuria sediminis]MUN64304.1 cupin domain-containing protein [Kocuria sediminis]
MTDDDDTASDRTAEGSFVLREADLPADGWDDARGRLRWRTLFSAGSTPTRGMVTGVAELPEGGFLALHRHDQAETYYVLSGRGVVVLEGVEHEVAPGWTVFVPGRAEHGARNTGDEPLRVHYVLDADDFAEVEYEFS